MGLVPHLPETAPFSSSQRAWLNGYLAGLFSFEAGGDGRQPPPPPAAPSAPAIGEDCRGTTRYCRSKSASLWRKGNPQSRC